MTDFMLVLDQSVLAVCHDGPDVIGKDVERTDFQEHECKQTMAAWMMVADLFLKKPKNNFKRRQ